MPKKLWKLFGLLLAIIPNTVWAISSYCDNTISDTTATTSIFEVGKMDTTRGFLGQLFGTVGTVLSGTSGQMLGQLFRVFNIGILVIAGIFFIWSVVQTVMNTAHEGQFMGGGGKKPAFTVLRTVFGFGLLVPSFATGYSMIQAAAMWIILQGVGFANTAWHEALCYFEKGGVMFVPPTQNISGLVDMAGTVMMAQVCMYYHEKKAREEAGAGSFVKFAPKWSGNSVSFPKNPGDPPSQSSSDSGCGRFTVPASRTPTQQQYIKAGLQQVIIGTSTAARRIVNQSASFSDADLCDLVSDSVLGAAADWTNILLPARNSRQGQPDLDAFFTKAHRDGWLMAGSYYFKLTGLQADFMDAQNLKFDVTKPSDGIINCSGSTCIYIDFPGASELNLNAKTGVTRQQFLSVCSSGMENLGTSDDTSLNALYSKTGGFIKAAVATTVQLQNELTEAPHLESPDLGIMTPLLAPVMDGIQGAMGNMSAGQSSGGADYDPVLKLKAAGETMVIVIAVIMIVGTILVFALSAIASIMSSVQPFGYAIRDMLMFLLTLLTPLLLMILTEGLILATYIPLIPFIIWTFAVIGYLIVVIETLIAAPLVALGLTHPEGHDSFGRSEPALMLLLAAFLRPILMIFGLFAGMMLSKIALQILGGGFATVLATSGAVNMFFILGLLAVYIALVIQLLNTCYGLITVIPDSVMKWIGGQGFGDMGGSKEALSGAKAGADKSGSAVSNVAGDSMKGGMKKGQSMDAAGSGGSADGGGGGPSSSGSASAGISSGGGGGGGSGGGGGGSSGGGGRSSGKAGGGKEGGAGGSAEMSRSKRAARQLFSPNTDWDRYDRGQDKKGDE